MGGVNLDKFLDIDVSGIGNAHALSVHSPIQDSLNSMGLRDPFPIPGHVVCTMYVLIV